MRNALKRGSAAFNRSAAIKTPGGAKITPIWTVL